MLIVREFHFVLPIRLSRDNFGNWEGRSFSTNFEIGRKQAHKDDLQSVTWARKKDRSHLCSMYRRTLRGNAPPFFLLPKEARDFYADEKVQAGLNEKRGCHYQPQLYEMALEVDQIVHHAEKNIQMYEGNPITTFRCLERNKEKTVRQAIEEVLQKHKPHFKKGRTNYENAVEDMRQYYYKNRREYGGRLYYTSPSYCYKNGVWQPYDGEEEEPLFVEKEFLKETKH